MAIPEEKGSIAGVTAASSVETSSSSVSPSLSDENLERASNHDAASSEAEGYRLATWRLIIVIFSLCVGLVLSLMDITIAASALYTISNDFKNFRQSNWVLIGYSSAYVGFATVFTRISEVFGRKTSVLASFALFIGFSLACGWAKSLHQLILFRCFQGAGGSGLYTMTMVVIPEISPVEWLPAVSAVIGASVAVAGVSGPIFGGLLTTFSSWRWCFWMNAPIGIVPVLLLIFLWPHDNHSKNIAAKSKLRHLDFAGVFTLMLGSVLLIIGLQQAGSRVWAWDSALTIAFLAFAAVSLVGFFVWQYALFRISALHKIHPQFPFALMKSRVMAACILSAFMTGYIYTSTIVNIPTRGQIVNILDAVDASIRLLPLLVASALGSFVAGYTCYKNNYTFHTMTLASCFMMLGTGLMSSLGISLNTQSRQWGFEVLLGFGFGLTFSTTTIIASLNTQFIHHAVAQGIISQMRVFGGIISVAVSTIVLNQKISKELAGVVTPSQMEEFFATPVAGYQWTLYQQSFVRKSMTSAFREEMLTCTYIATACLVLSLFTYQKVPPTMLERKRQLEALYRREGHLPMGAI